MKWVEESEVLGTEVGTEDNTEVCVFCSKSFSTHHGYTAHLRRHGDDLNNHVLNIIASASKPMSIRDIQALSGIRVDVRNSIYRLIEQNKIRRAARGMYSANKRVAATKQPTTTRHSIPLKDIMENAEWDSLIIAQLKKHPDLYQRLSNEVIEGIKKYIAFSAEV